MERREKKGKKKKGNYMNCQISVFLNQILDVSGCNTKLQQENEIPRQTFPLQLHPLGKKLALRAGLCVEVTLPC